MRHGCWFAFVFDKTLSVTIYFIRHCVKIGPHWQFFYSYTNHWHIFYSYTNVQCIKMRTQLILSSHTGIFQYIYLYTYICVCFFCIKPIHSGKGYSITIDLIWDYYTVISDRVKETGHNSFTTWGQHYLNQCKWDISSAFSVKWNLAEFNDIHWKCIWKCNSEKYR